MDALWSQLPWILTMAVLIGCSGFFSASEAALFSLRGSERRALATGSHGDRTAERLLQNPDRLLSAVLFWNLVVNMLYFAIATMVSLHWQQQTLSFSFAIGSLLMIIFFSEMLPKSIAVMQARFLASRVSIPLSMAVRAVDPIMPVLQTVNLLSRRLIWPGLKEEPYLEINDLERAIGLSSTNAKLIEQEKKVLANIVKLSDLRVREWMRPRTQFRSFRPPVTVVELGHEIPPSGYLLVTEPDGDEIAAAVSLQELSDAPPDHLERLARPIVYVPWCASVSDVLEQLHRKSVEVAAVVNELGETIGIVTLPDIYDAVLTAPGRSERILNRKPIVQLGPNLWQVAGMMNLRRLADDFQTVLPGSRNVTLGGVVQETLERLPQVGDECTWGPFKITVLTADDDAELLLEVEWRGEEDSP